MTRDLMIYAPVAKSLEREDGRMEIEVLASDSGFDIEDERIRPLKESLPYLEQQGHFDDNHSDYLLGDIDRARFVSQSWIQEHFPESKAVGSGVYLKGTVYKPNDEMPQAQRDGLARVRGLLKAGGKLGASLFGCRVSAMVNRLEGRHVVDSTVLATRCALTPHPVNPRAMARPIFAKSLAEGMDRADEMAEAGEEGTPVIVVLGGLQPNTEMAADARIVGYLNVSGAGVAKALRGFAEEFTKSLTLSTGTDLATMTGGDAGKLQDLEGAPKKRRRKKPKRGSGEGFGDIADIEARVAAARKG